jgi:hypothetical protein
MKKQRTEAANPLPIDLRRRRLLFTAAAGAVLSGCGGSDSVASAPAGTPPTGSTPPPATPPNPPAGSPPPNPGTPPPAAPSPPTPPPPVGTGIAAFSLISATAQTAAPFMLGHGFRRGDVPSGTELRLSEPSGRVVVKRRWRDGSVKHAVIVGRADVAANTLKVISILVGAPAAGADLTAASIQSAAPAASVQCGSIGTVSLASLLGSPIRTWISTPEMVECHYRAAVGADPNLVVFFHVRLWAGGRLWVRAIVENGYLDNVAGTASNATSDKNYVPTVVIGGSTVYSNGGAALAHYANTRWTAEGWIGADPGVTPMHNAAYLRATKLVPNYGWNNPSATPLNTYDGAYTPMSRGDTVAAMGSAGYQPHIGLLPLWNALYAQSADPRAWRATMKNSSAINSRGIVWRSRATNRIPTPTSHPTWTIGGPATGGTPGPTRGTLVWEYHHHPLESYFAYLISGDYWHYESLALQGAMIYFCIGSGRGSGVNRLLMHDEIRGIAWGHRTVGAYCALAHEGDTEADVYRTWLQTSGFQHWRTKGPNNPAGNMLGYPLGLSTYDEAKPLQQAPWQMHFWMQTNGFLWDIEPGQADTTAQQAVRDWMYRGVVGILGGNGTDSFCYTAAGNYVLTVSPVIKPNFAYTEPAELYSTWGEVFQATFGTANTACGTTLAGTLTPFAYWANLMPAIAYAVDHGAPGAAAAYARLTGATNWPTLRDSGWDNAPIWGVAPRT